MADFYIKQNDTLPAIVSTLADATYTPVNLTGATVTFSMVSQGGTVVISKKTATVNNAVGGQVQYAWAAGDTATADVYLAEWEVTFAGGGVETFPNDSSLRIQVTAEVV